MAKTFHFKNTDMSHLLERKEGVLSQMRVPAHSIRASVVRQFLTCGKKNCRCHRGAKHGPFDYLVQCVKAFTIRKFLLKTARQRDAARRCVAAYAAFQERLEELSQINTELLRRGELSSELRL